MSAGWWRKAYLNVRIPCEKCTKNLTHKLLGFVCLGKLSWSNLAVILNDFSNCGWMFALVLSGDSKSKEFCVLRTLKWWLEKKKKSQLLHCSQIEIQVEDSEPLPKGKELPPGLGPLSHLPQGPSMKRGQYGDLHVHIIDPLSST